MSDRITLWRIYRSRDGIYRRYRTVDGIKEVRSTGSRDQALALEIVAELNRREINPALHRGASRAPFRDSLTVYWVQVQSLQGRKARKISEATRSAYKTQIGHVARLLADVPHRDISADILQGYVDARRAENVVDHTIAKELGHVRGALRIAFKTGLIAVDPAPMMPEVAPGYRPRSRVLTQTEALQIYERIRDAGKKTSARLAARFAWYLATGCRKSEVDRAERAHVDRARGLVKIIGTKTSASAREIPIVFPEWMDRALAGAASSGPMFPRAGNELRCFRTHAAALGFARFSRNDLRRSYASWVLARGVPSHVAARLLGHTSPTMIDRVYGRLSGDELRALVERSVKPE